MIGHPLIIFGMFLSNIAKLIWRQFYRLKYKTQNVHLSEGVHFNQKTKFGNNIRIGQDTWISDSEIGDNSYIGNNCSLPNCHLGMYCSIGPNVKVINDSHPTRNFVSTSPIFYSTNKQCGVSYVTSSKYEEKRTINGRNLIVGNDVWIGKDVKIISGITIGDGAVIGMNAVVTKDIPPYAIVGGVPAKLIRYRFETSIIDKLLEFKWWNKPEEWIKEHVELFANIEEFIKVLD